MGKNVKLALEGKPPTIVKLLPMDVLAVATGQSRGTGRLGSIKMFSFMVYMAKGKTLATERFDGYINGSVA